MANRIQYRRDTAANWTTTNPVLALGEPAVETDTKKSKIGDGATAWAALAYQPNTTDLSATYAALPPGWVEGLPTISCGHSWTVSPGINTPAGASWNDRLARRNFGPSPVLYGIAGSTMAEAAFSAVGNAWYTGYSANASEPAGNLRTLGTKTLGAIYLECVINDTIINVASDPAHQSGYKHALRTFLAAAIAGQRVEAEAGTRVGFANVLADAKFSAGSCIYTNVAGDSVTWTATVPAGVTTVYVLAPVTDAGNPFGKLDVAVDGVTVTTAWTPTGQFKSFASLTAVAATYTFGHAVIPVTVTPGSRTIKVTKSAGDASNVYLDALLIPSGTPPVIIVAKDPAVPYGTNGTYRATYDGFVDSVCAEFPSVKVVDLNIGWDSTMIGVDSLHPNAKGQYALANSYAAALKTALTGYTPGVTQKA